MSTLRPLSLVLMGRLADVMESGRLSVVDNSHGARRLQLLRYSCGSEAFCRLVRLQVVVGSEIIWTITPAGQTDELRLKLEIPEGQPFELRIIRDPLTSPSILPSPFPGSDVRFEAFG